MLNGKQIGSGTIGGVKLTVNGQDNAQPDLLAIDGSGNLYTREASSIGGGGGTPPGGADTEIQFNNAGVFDGDSNWTWNNTTKVTRLGTASQHTDIFGGSMIMRTYNGSNSFITQNSTGYGQKLVLLGTQGNTNSINFETEPLSSYMVKFTGTTSIILPVGTTAQRPGAVAGMVRFNSTTSKMEFYTGSGWETITSS